MRVNPARPFRTKALAGNPLILVYDEFIKGEKLRRDLRSVHDSLLPDRTTGAAVWAIHERGRRQYPPSPIRRFARLVLGCIGTVDIAVVEYWTNTTRAGHGIPRHVDKDEWLYRESGNVVSPVISAVYYADRCRFQGGELEVADVRISPRQNRLVIFAGHLQHHVHAVAAGIRRSLVVNVWRSRPTSPQSN